MAQSINAGTKMEIFNVTLNDSTDTPVTLGKTPNNILIRNRADTGAIYLRLTDNSPEYFTIPESIAITIDIGSRVLTPIYLRAETGTPVAELIVSYE